MQSSFQVRLKQLRMDKRITQAEMAELLKITTRNYQDYEGGRAYPRVPGLIELANFFDISLDYLVGRSDDPARR